MHSPSARQTLLRSLALCLLLIGHTASASSPDSWKKLATRTKKACLKESGFKKPKVKGAAIMFASHVLYVIEGTSPEAQMKGAKNITYCLHPFDGKPEVSAAPIPF